MRSFYILLTIAASSVLASPGKAGDRLASRGGISLAGTLGAPPCRGSECCGGCIGNPFHCPCTSKEIDAKTLSSVTLPQFRRPD